MLNVYLDHHLDRYWAKQQSATPLIRVADDLLVPARDRVEAETAHEHLRVRLQSAGMTLEGSPDMAVRDLDRDPGDWLGFRLRKGPGGLEVRPTEGSWAKLDEHLGLAHTKPAAPIRALETIEGWTEQHGPCRPHLGIADFYAGIASVASGYAFDEIPPLRALEERLLRGYLRWTSLRRCAGVLPMEQDLAAPPARV